MRDTTLTDFIQETENFAESKKGRSHLRCWYRGHADESWLLVPKLYPRDPNNKKRLNRDAILRQERHLVRDFRLMSASVRAGDESDAQLYFLQQHYGMPTRLLDWTTNPLIALYFSCADEKYDNVNGEVFFLDAYAMGLKSQPNGAPFGVATDRREGFRAWMDFIFNWKDKPDKKLIEETFPIRPEHFDRRISLQQGCFTFHHPDHPSIAKSDRVQIFKIPSRSKGTIRKQLTALNVNHFSVYGDLAALARHLSDNRHLY
jgi:hypothetical protein